MATLEDFVDLPLFKMEYKSGTRTTQVVEGINWYKQSGEGTDPVYPEAEALRFYLGQDLFGHARVKFGLDEHLPKDWGWMLTQAYQNMASVAMRMSAYLPVICTREVRHMHMEPKDVTGALATFLSNVKGVSYDDAISKFLNSPPNVVIASYAKALSDNFAKNHWGGGFGGKAWLDVSEVYRKMVYGEMSLEAMTDQGFSLAHNNGPIFNKGFVYQMYSKNELYKILDCQRAGQIPQLIASKQSPFVAMLHPSVMMVVERAKKWLPEYGMAVDWAEVQNADPMGSYSNLIPKAQATKSWVAKQIEVGNQTFKENGLCLTLKPDETVQILERA